MGDFYTCETVTAAKPHKCEECGRTIAVGEKYAKHAQVFDGEFYRFKTCGRCEALRSEAFKAFDWFGPEEAPGLGDLERELREEYGVADPDEWLAARREHAAFEVRLKAAQAQWDLEQMARCIGWPLPLPPEIAA